MQASIDIETLSIRARPAILALAAVPFEFGKPLSTADRFYCAVDLGDAMRHGGVDADTLRWWLTQGDEARRAALGHGEMLEEVLERFASWIDRLGVTNLWAEGPSFDLAHLAEAFRSVGHEPHWNFRSERCVRTALAIWDPDGMHAVRSAVPHHALYDAEAQALSLLAAHADWRRRAAEVDADLSVAG